MARHAWLCLMFGIGNSLSAAEPLPPARPLLMVHHAGAEPWLTSLGSDLVQIESFLGQKQVSTAPETTDWAAIETRIRHFAPPTAFVYCHHGEDRLAEFWGDRLRNQGTLTIVVQTPTCRGKNRQHDCRLIRESHAILVRLCPAAKDVLDQRLIAELARQGALNNSLATLARQ
jgi:hypothetical protein